MFDCIVEPIRVNMFIIFFCDFGIPAMHVKKSKKVHKKLYTVLQKSYMSNQNVTNFFQFSECGRYPISIP